MKKTFLLLTALFLGGIVMAGPVGPEKARKAAEGFLQTKKLQDVSSLAGLSNVYVFQCESGRGFVMVAGDDRVNPILGFSFDQPFVETTISPEMHYWMTRFSGQISSSESVESPISVQEKWNQLVNGQTLVSAKADSVAPLLETTWNQTPKYNMFCPGEGGDGTNNCPVGCLALAYAQIMKYYEFPKHGYGSNSYNWESVYDDWTYGTLYARFDSVNYKYDKMPNRIQNSTSILDVRATAWLCYQVGIAIDMHYTRNGSGGFMITEYTHECTSDPVYEDMATEFRIPRHFGYKYRDAALRREYSDSAWVAELLADIDAARPIHYAGWYYNEEGTAIESGHAFVLDGYVRRGGELYYHVNWGWGGSGNGWFLLDALDPGNMTFDDLQGAILGLEPDHSRLTMTDNLAVERHGRNFRCMVANIGTESFEGLFGVRLTNETDTLWLVAPTQKTLVAGDTIDFGMIHYPHSIPSGTYKATAMYGYSERSMLPIADFEFSNHCDVYIDLDVEKTDDEADFVVTAREGLIRISNLTSNQPVEVVDMMGRRVAFAMNPDEIQDFQIPVTGVYVVRQGRQARKIVVR